MKHRKLQLVLTYKDGKVLSFGQSDINLARKSMYTMDNPDVVSYLLVEQNNTSRLSPTFRIIAFEYGNSFSG